MIYLKLININEQGKSSILISTDNDELLRLSDRICVIYKGKLSNTVDQLIGGMKSCFGYCGSKNISEMHKIMSIFINMVVHTLSIFQTGRENHSGWKSGCARIIHTKDSKHS